MIQLIDFIKIYVQGFKITALILSVIILLWTALGVDTHHAHTWVEKHIPLFWSLFTLLSAIVVIFVANFIGKNIQTREDYYDK